MADTGAGSSKLTAHGQMRSRWRRVGRRLALRAETPAEFRRWRAALRRKLKSLTGYDAMERAPLRPKITEGKRLDGYARQRVEIHTEPRVVMSMYVLIPEAGGPPSTPVIAAHGHSSGGKLAVVGERTGPELAQTIREHNYDYGVQMVRAGFIVFCPDARGFGERQEAQVRQTGTILNSSCALINHMAIPLGQTVTGMWAWDLHRLADYIQTRSDCRGDAIGCIGLSGGGLQTLWAAALDERIRCAIVSGYFYGYEESLLDLCGNCSCNYVPHLWEYADMGDIGALIAPRPLMIETGTKDPLNGAGGLKNVRSQLRITRRAYRLLGAAGRLNHHVFEGPHRWDGTTAVPWLRRWLA